MFLPLTLLLIATFAYAALATEPVPAAAPSPTPVPTPVILHWVPLSSDSRDVVREIIRSEVDNREGFSSALEESANIKAVEERKGIEDYEYKNAITNANKEFIRSKKKRDDATTEFHAFFTELEEFAKGIKTMRATINNLEGQTDRYEQDIKTQQESLKRWLQTEKQGEVIVAVIYTRGFKDSAHELEGAADKASAPLIAGHMGTYIQSFTKTANNIISDDFIRATEEGTAKWNNEEPLRIELEKGEKGTTYLRLKRYELYPFKESKTGKIISGPPSAKYRAAIINTRKELDDFMMQNQYPPKDYSSDKIDSLIKDTAQSNVVTEEVLNEQVKSFQEKIGNLQNKVNTTNAEKESQKIFLKQKEDTYDKMIIEAASIREKKDAAERQLHEAQATLHEKKRLHESIIIKTALATTKGSQTPAEASAEAILDKLEEVKNDARTQHSSSTTEVNNFQVTAETSKQSITEARIIAINLISFINEGDSVRVKMAFRVKTVLEEQTPAEEPVKPNAEAPVIASPETKPESTSAEPVKTNDEKGRQQDLGGVLGNVWSKTKGLLKGKQKESPVIAAPKTKAEPTSKETFKANSEPPVIAVSETKSEPALENPPEEIPAISPFKRNYRPLATKDALGCLFDLRAVKATKEGIQIILEVINTDKDVRSVAFYDERFGTWNKSKIFDQSNKYYNVTKAYVIQGAQKRLMYDIDSRGHGIELQPQTSVTMELFFKNIPANIKNLRINLHPFIYYQKIWITTWQEFDLFISDIHLDTKAAGAGKKKK